MLYLLLAYQSEPRLSMETGDDVDRASLAALSERGYLLGLGQRSSCASVQVQAGELVISSELASQDKLSLQNLFLIQACDLNEAVRLAGSLPQAQRGPLEIWPLVEPCAHDKTENKSKI